MTGKNLGVIAVAVGAGLVLLACSSDPPASPYRSGATAGSTAFPTGGSVSTTGGQGGTGAPFVPAPGAGSGGTSGASGTTAGASGSTAGSSGAGAGGDSGAAGTAGAAGSMPPICEDDAGVADEDAGTDGCVTTGDVRLQYKAADTNPADNAVKPHFNVVNDGGAAIALERLTIRYWYTLEPNAPSQVFWCDYAEIGCSSVEGSFVAEARMGATHYLQVGFKSGSLAAHADSGEIQTRFNKEDWSNFAENDDYSFDPTKTAFADWYKVTLYLDGMLIWGQEPPPL